MNTLGNCPHCGAPITLKTKIIEKIAVCDYCDSQFIVPEQLFNSIVEYNNKQEEKIKHKQREEELYNEQVLEKKMEQQRKQDVKKGLRILLAILTIPFGGGCFGITSFICGRPLLGLICIIITFTMVAEDAPLNFWVILAMIIIPILSIIFMKEKDIK